jgi:ribosomal protein S27E/flagellar basal body rod protein FlgC
LKTTPLAFLLLLSIFLVSFFSSIVYAGGVTLVLNETDIQDDTITQDRFPLANNPDTYHFYESFELDFDFEEPVINGRFTWDRLGLKDGFFNPIPGEPQVPCTSVVFNCPVIYEDLKLEVTLKKSTVITALSLPPIQEPEFLIAEAYNASGSNLKSSAALQQYLAMDTYLPDYDYLLAHIDSEQINGELQNRYSLLIFPCKYNPRLEKAIIYESAEVKIFGRTIELFGTEVPNTKDSQNGDTEQPDGTETNLAPNPGKEVKYLILTTAPLMDELTPLAAWKQRKGLTTEIVDVNTIYNNQTFDGYDSPDELRNFITYMHQNLGTEYVLLAGDYDTVPPRMCHDPDPYYGADDGEIPADSYYACIDEGTTWDDDGDHIYGELGDLDDIYPDIVVGRVAINSEAKMRSWVEEMINYECNPPLSHWTNKVILIGPNVHNEGDGAEQSEYFYDNYLKYIYGSFDKYYESSDVGEPLVKSEIINSINQGTTFLNYLGHGGPTVWTYNYGYNVLFDKGDVNKFKNGRLKPVVYAMSCLTGWFDDPSDSGYGNFGDCIGETYTENVENGGIGYIGSARTSVGSVGSGYGPFATGLQEDFIRQLGQYNFILGEAYTEGKKHYSESFGSIFTDSRTSGEVQACWLEINLLGEPELPLWTATPQRFNITNVTSDNSLMISICNETNEPVVDATVCLQAKAALGGIDKLLVQQTSTSGETVFDITGLPVKVNLTVTKINHIPYLETITLRDMIPPESKLDITPITPDGENNWYITTPSINLTMNEEGVIYYYWDDENNPNGSRTYFEPIPVPEGEHTLYFYSEDSAQNVEPLHEFKVKVDTTVPECRLSLDPFEPDGNNGWYIHKPFINITTDTGGVVFYAFDDDINLSFPGELQAPEGEHEIHYYAKDQAGNVGEACTTTLKVDITPPRTDLILDPESPTGSKLWYKSNFMITLTTEDSAESYYYWDSGNLNNSILYRDPFTCPEGVHELFFYSIDYAGCIEPFRSKVFKLDTQPPVVERSVNPIAPDGENGYYVSDATITLTSEPNATLYYYWNSNSDTPILYTRPIHSLEGDHELTYFATDVAGNTGLEVTIEMKVDTTNPKTEILITPSEPDGDNDYYIQSPRVEFITEPGEVVYYHFGFDKETVAGAYIEIPEGNNKLYYYSIDLAGNIGEEQSKTLKVDLTPPHSVLESDMLTYFINDIIYFDASKSSDNNQIIAYYIDYGDGANSGWMSNPEFMHRYRETGEYRVTLSVKDDAGQVNKRPEDLDILIVKKPKDPDFFSVDNMYLVILVVLGIFGILSTYFMVYHRSYGSAVRSPQSERRMRQSKHTPEPRRELVTGLGYEPDVELEPEPVEAIILDNKVLRRLKKIRCGGCGNEFIADPTEPELKCPGCGAPGTMNDTKRKLKTRSRKTTETDSDFNKFKCPNCGKAFKTPKSVEHGIVRCPGCGITGEI